MPEENLKCSFCQVNDATHKYDLYNRKTNKKQSVNLCETCYNNTIKNN